jgi:hypothetical protein
MGSSAFTSLMSDSGRWVRDAWQAAKPPAHHASLRLATAATVRGYSCKPAGSSVIHTCPTSMEKRS